jgi:GT2 family glycosyltransferase
VVINNASTDGTEAMLRERGVPFITQENLGSAGGWRRSIEYAIAEGFDAVWLMDDDGFPKADALAALERAMKSDVACASSIVVREDMPTHFVFPVAKLNKSGLPVIWGAPRKMGKIDELRQSARGGEYPFAYLFNGALVSTEAAKKIGNVNAGFFIFGDEVDYFFRLRSAGKVISVIDAIHFHPDVTQRPYTRAKVYYYVKNTLILNSRYFNAAALRDVLTIAAALGRVAKRNGLLAAASFLVGANAPLFYLAVVRGLQGKVGKDLVG